VFAHHRLLSFDPEFDAVTAMVADADGGVHAIRARYLVGCDGLHSGVRTRSGIGFSGTENEQTFALADVRTAGGDDVPRVDFTFSADGMLLRSPLPDGVLRFVATVPRDTKPLDRDGVQHLIDTRVGPGHGTTVTEVLQSSSYHVSSRLADTFSKDRVFLVGDAAHVHSPAGGQGMNTGIQDAVNLAWKLAAVLDGDDPALLDTYDTERRPNAAGVLGITGQITTLAQLTDPTTMALRDQVLRAVGGIDAVPRTLAAKLSQLDVGYAGPDPVGRRLPITEPPAVGLRWSDAEWADGRKVRVRPDGYVAEVR
jgi:2-polyprenyl-6-methoxyphenol hydroxylase-like FAD-dependent oxidoreductase